MEKFDYCLQKIFEAEGGYSNDPKDHGGSTKFGVTKLILSAFRSTLCTDADVQALTMADARTIYWDYFWIPANMNLIQDAHLCRVVFDQVVNRGPRSAIKDLQRAMNVVIGKIQINEDGVLGTETAKTLALLPAEKVGMKFVQSCQLFYCRDVQDNPTQIRFLSGWISRTHKLLDELYS